MASHSQCWHPLFAKLHISSSSAAPTYSPEAISTSTLLVSAPARYLRLTLPVVSPVFLSVHDLLL